MNKIIVLAILTLGISNASFSQSKGLEKKADELVEKLNLEIIEGDKTLALSDEQKKQIKEIHIERLKALKKLDNSASKEDKKEVNKTYSQKIFKEILTKEQMKARKKGKEENEE